MSLKKMRRILANRKLLDPNRFLVTYPL